MGRNSFGQDHIGDLFGYGFFVPAHVNCAPIN
jgi:hypothetical protein